MSLIALTLIIIAGILLGIFSIPVNKVKTWQFEHIWGAGSVAALILVPWPLVLLFIPEVSDIYREISLGTLLAVVFAGFAWGIGGIFWGLGISTLGIALGVSLMTSIINVFGSIGPLYAFEPELLLTEGGRMLIFSLIILIVGIVATAMAGHFKEKSLSPNNNDQVSDKPQKASFLTGLTFCVLSGILSCGVNFGLVFGTPIAEKTSALGVPDYAKNFAIWSLVFTSNYLVNAFYGIYIMIKKNNVHQLWRGVNRQNWIWVLFMGLAWPGGVIIYGIGANFMGPMGAYVGFPMVMLVSILAGNVAGLLDGEWKGTDSKSKLVMILGVLIIFIAFIFLGYSNQLLS